MILHDTDTVDVSDGTEDDLVVGQFLQFPEVEWTGPLEHGRLEVGQETDAIDVTWEDDSVESD